MFGFWLSAYGVLGFYLGMFIISTGFFDTVIDNKEIKLKHILGGLVSLPAFVIIGLFCLACVILYWSVKLSKLDRILIKIGKFIEKLWNLTIKKGDE